MSSKIVPQLQVQSRTNGLVIALPNHQGVAGLAKHFNTRGDNELIFAEVKVTAAGRRKAASGEHMKIGSPAEEGEDTAANGKTAGRKRTAPAAGAADDLA